MESWIAGSIDAEYKRKQIYAKKERQKCKQQNCKECKYQEICVDREIEDEI